MFKFLICFIAGIGARLGTGFAGMSAGCSWNCYSGRKLFKITQIILLTLLHVSLPQSYTSRKYFSVTSLQQISCSGFLRHTLKLYSGTSLFS